ncbi:MAG: Holliday junction resolvase RuvX [SAR202 cluster bacterium]|nr:Holliday junction resolvase RuvX [SAR202 cluster bacterium]
MRIMALDLGEKKTGVAISDSDHLLAIPHGILETDSNDFFKQLASITEEYSITRIVVGLPLSLDGAPRRQARWVKSMQKKISNQLNVGVETWDERLSTIAVQHLPKQSKKMKRNRSQIQEDADAAAFILQGYLDRQKNILAQDENSQWIHKEKDD